jgi:beta-hydroxylase
VSIHQKTDKNPQFFYNTKDFPFLNVLTTNFKIIQAELLNLLESNKENQWMETFPHYVNSDKAKAWKVFSFVFFGLRFPQNAALCPETAKLIYAIPEILSCDYSFLKPNTHIAPHKGYTRMVLRCHLPLIVPGGHTCKLRVGDEIREWEEKWLEAFQKGEFPNQSL